MRYYRNTHLLQLDLLNAHGDVILLQPQMAVAGNGCCNRVRLWLVYVSSAHTVLLRDLVP